MGRSVVREVADAASLSIQSLGRLEALAARSAPAFIEATAMWAGLRIVAVEGFKRLEGDTYQPAVDWILDLSSIADPAACRREAHAFVEEAPDDLLFAFDLERPPDPRT